MKQQRCIPFKKAKAAYRGRVRGHGRTAKQQQVRKYLSHQRKNGNRQQAFVGALLLRRISRNHKALRNIFADNERAGAALRVLRDGIRRGDGRG